MHFRIKLVTWAVSLRHSYRKSSMQIRSPLNRKSFHRWPICAKWVSKISNPASNTKCRVLKKCTTSWTIHLLPLCATGLKVVGKTDSLRGIAARESIGNKIICPTQPLSWNNIKVKVEVLKTSKISGYIEIWAAKISNRIRLCSQTPHTAFDSAKVSHWRGYASPIRWILSVKMPRTTWSRTPMAAKSLVKRARLRRKASAKTRQRPQRSHTDLKRRVSS